MTMILERYVYLSKSRSKRFGMSKYAGYRVGRVIQIEANNLYNLIHIPRQMRMT